MKIKRLFRKKRRRRKGKNTYEPVTINITPILSKLCFIGWLVYALYSFHSLIYKNLSTSIFGYSIFYNEETNTFTPVSDELDRGTLYIIKGSDGTYKTSSSKENAIGVCIGWEELFR